MSDGVSVGRSLRLAFVAVCLAGLTLAVFWPVTGYDFVTFDDDIYVTNNPWVGAGLGVRTVQWAFTSVGYAANWHPLTWISHLLDVSVFGLRPGGHHATSLVIHLAATITLLLVLHAATGALWRSAAVAALFAVHPLHVESVAWVSERKDVLCAFFFFLTLGAWVRYARQPGGARYGAVVVAFALALLAKSMAVTLPFLLLALDWWPLGRFHAARGGSTPARHFALRLVAEKIPLFLLAAAAGALTYLAQSRDGSVAPARVLAFATRAMNAADSAVMYLRATMLPEGLAILYPYPTHGWGALPASRISLELGLLAVVTALALILRRRIPALAVGWCWYLGLLVPVSGLIHVGIQARADRYTYLPLCGIFIALAWALPVRAAKWRHGGAAWGAAGCVVVLLLAIQARVQVGTWRDSITLFGHATAVTRNNWQANANLGKVLAAAGRQEEAVAAYREALRLLPYLDEERRALGGLLMSLGRPAEAVEELRTAARARPELWVRHFNLGVALAAAGRRDEAVAEYRRTIELKPLCAPAFNNLGTISGTQGRIEDARRQFTEAIRIDPSFVEARYNLGVLAAQLGKSEEAVAHWEEVLRIDPNHAGARRELAGRARQDLTKY